MWWKVAAVAGALGVLLGAFGAHGLRDVVSEPRLLEIWETGARYHLVHALALCAVAAHPAPPRGAGLLFVLGILLFSGSLYALALSGVGVLGAITPLGGLAFVGGWILLGFAPGPRAA